MEARIKAIWELKMKYFVANITAVVSNESMVRTEDSAKTSSKAIETEFHRRMEALGLVVTQMDITMTELKPSEDKNPGLQ